MKLSTYYNEIKDFPTLTEEEEQKCGKYLKLKDSLFLLKKENLKKELDLKKILFYLKEDKYTEIILKTIEDFYKADESNNKEDFNLLKKYKEYRKKEKRIPTKDELKKYFGIINVDNPSINNSFLITQIDKYIKYKQAYTKLIESNLKLVVSIVKKIYAFNNNGDDELLELISQGNLALIECVDRFDVSLGNKFSTYAYQSIKGTINKYILKNKFIISVDVPNFYKIRKFLENKELLEKKEKRKLSFKELSEKLNISVEKIISYYRIINNNLHLSLYEKIQDEDDTLLIDVIKDESPIAEEILENEDIDIIYSFLDETEQKIIKLFFGIDAEKPMSCKQISKVIKLSPLVVERRLNTAMQKLKKVALTNETVIALKQTLNKRM